MSRTSKTGVTAIALVAMLLAGTATGPATAPAKKHHGKKHRKKRVRVATRIVLNETPAMTGRVIARRRCQARRYVQVRRFGNDALVGSATSHADGTFWTAANYSGPAYAFSRPGPRGKRAHCLAGLSAVTSIGVADLAISQAAVPPAMETGMHPAYDLTLSNLGPDVAQDVVIAASPEPQTPSGTFDFDIAHSTPGCARRGEIVACEIYAVRPGMPVTIRVALACTGDTTAFLDTAAVTSSARDPAPSNNTTGPDYASCM